MHVKKSIYIKAPALRVFDFWSDVEGFASFIPILDSVQIIDDLHSRWLIKAPLGYRVLFDSTVVESIPGELLIWDSYHRDGNARGEITFIERNEGTLVQLHYTYHLRNPVLQRIARAVSIYGFPSIAFDKGMQRIKKRIESLPDQI